MKIALTGHKRGLGECLYSTLLHNGHEVVAFDLHTGYNINDGAIRRQILEESSNCEVFINNAYCAPGQFELLRLVVESEKIGIVLNVGTMATKIPREILLADPSWQRQPDNEVYLQQKLLQEGYVEKMRNRCNSLLLTINPGYMDTSLLYGPVDLPYVPLDDVCRGIMMQIELAEKNVYVPDINIVALPTNS